MTNTDLEEAQQIANKKNCFDFCLHYQFYEGMEFTWKEYRHLVDSASRHKIETGDLSLDHIFSVWEGFRHNVNPAIISHRKNLRAMELEKNIEKSTQCDISFEALVDLIEKDTTYETRLHNADIIFHLNRNQHLSLEYNFNFLNKFLKGTKKDFFDVLIYILKNLKSPELQILWELKQNRYGTPEERKKFTDYAEKLFGITF